MEFSNGCEEHSSAEVKWKRAKAANECRRRRSDADEECLRCLPSEIVAMMYVQAGIH